MDINTPEDWWIVLAQHKEALLETIKIGFKDDPQMFRLVPDERDTNSEGKWLGEMHVKLCAEFPRKHEPVTAFGKFLHGLDTKNHEMILEILQDIWGASPDNESIHYRPAWGALCDLLSEAWVFYEESESSPVPGGTI